MMRFLPIAFTTVFLMCVSVHNQSLVVDNCVRICMEKSEETDRLAVEKDLKDQLEYCLDGCEDNSDLCMTICHLDYGSQMVPDLQREKQDVRKENCEDECKRK